MKSQIVVSVLYLISSRLQVRNAPYPNKAQTQIETNTRYPDKQLYLSA